MTPHPPTVRKSRIVRPRPAERLRLAASQPTSDFDKVVEEVKRIEHSEPPKPKKPGRKKKGGEA
jgi:hypothetical protein